MDEEVLNWLLASVFPFSGSQRGLYPSEGYKPLLWDQIKEILDEQPVERPPRPLQLI